MVAAIASYNFPLTNMAGKVAPALAMGNTVIMKPAPQDPLAVVELARVLDEVGFPPGVVNLVNAEGPEPASVLTTSPDVDMVSFTGSTAVGQRIAAAGAPTMKRLLMELGGKGAAVVFDDADLKSAVIAIGSTWAFHSGQICTAPTRAVVHRSIFDQVVEGLSAFAGRLKVGDPTEAGDRGRTAHLGAPSSRGCSTTSTSGRAGGRDRRRRRSPRAPARPASTSSRPSSPAPTR